MYFFSSLWQRDLIWTDLTSQFITASLSLSFAYTLCYTMGGREINCFLTDHNYGEHFKRFRDPFLTQIILTKTGSGTTAWTCVLAYMITRYPFLDDDPFTELPFRENRIYEWPKLQLNQSYRHCFESIVHKIN